MAKPAPTDCSACVSKLCRFARSQAPQRAQRVYELVRGERIATCDGPCFKFWTVLGGTAAICYTLSDGRRQISAIERAGSTLGGPMARAESPIWLEAVEPTRVCEIDLSADLAALRDEPAFMDVMFEVVHARPESATRHLTTLGRLDSTERVMLLLAETAAYAPDGAPAQLPLSREDIGDYLGLKAETVSRVFTKLKRSGLFRFLSPTAFEVPDPEALARRLPVPVRRRRLGPVLPERSATEPRGAAQARSDGGCPASRTGAPRYV